MRRAFCAMSAINVFRFALHLSLALSLSLFPACDRAMDRAEIVVLNGAEPETIDPALLTGQPDGRIAYTLFEGLTSFDQTGTPQPGVAERWDLSPDARVYTFHLRKNAKWSNGDPVTSEDFIRSWERTLKPETASEYAGQLYYIHNAKPFNEGAVKDFRGRTAVITGAASGLGLETCRRAAVEGMNIVMADLQADALERAAAEIRPLLCCGANALPFHLDVSQAQQVEALGAATLDRFGTPNFVFNNAGVAVGGLIWEHSAQDWAWTLGVNVMGVAHGVRVFVPPMLAAARADPAYEGHIVNTASMAGLVNAPNMGAYNVSKHAVVSLSETLYHDLALVTHQINASVLCPFFVPTGISASHRNRPAEMAAGQATASQRAAQAMIGKAVESGKVSAAAVAGFVFDALREQRFYIYSHPKAMASVQMRLEDVVQARNPSDPFAGRPEIGATLRALLRESR